MYIQIFGYGIIIELRENSYKRPRLYTSSGYSEFRWFRLSVSFGKV